MTPKRLTQDLCDLMTMPEVELAAFDLTTLHKVELNAFEFMTMPEAGRHQHPI
jgi:hypothetical protein